MPRPPLRFSDLTPESDTNLRRSRSVEYETPSHEHGHGRRHRSHSRGVDHQMQLSAQKSHGRSSRKPEPQDSYFSSHHQRSLSASSSSSVDEDDRQAHRSRSSATGHPTHRHRTHSPSRSRSRSRSVDKSSHQQRSGSRHRPSPPNREPSNSHPAVYGQDRRDPRYRKDRDFRDSKIAAYHPPSSSRPGRVRRREHRHPDHRHRDHRRRDDSSDSSDSSSDDESEKHGNGQSRSDILMGAARVAFEAGALAAYKMRGDDRPWVGPKGTKVVATAIGAAAVDTFMEMRHPDRKGGIRHTVMRQATPLLLNLALRPAGRKATAVRPAMRRKGTSLFGRRR
ncbi:hypothetical protein B0T26DRAFT_673899 [Lasiosphaeria miniovina]|uniref:Uncharacterized protein n=1 Tax=Lasiosphaeria miniovina TaxID=1954250 RepID=A0AA40AUH2_9PEZI|nr:uncharacterized protein B0T26DRAFT_673899 [Lasiosphaeria miniovina]KAK0722159.1 hypothetical protein B0T26DRAFT_673899 [Lasiosphaeria miniovina]